MSLRRSFDDVPGRRIIDFNIWALDEGLRGTADATLGLDLIDLLAALNEQRAAAAKPTAAVDRLDFTVIGPAVNEVARIAALCEPLGRSVLVSAEFATAAVTCADRLQPLGRHAPRGVREPRDILALVLD